MGYDLFVGIPFIHHRQAGDLLAAFDMNITVHCTGGVGYRDEYAGR